jgi:hypothetical protein
MITIDDDHLSILAGMAELLTVEENHGFVPEFNAKRPLGNSMKVSVARDIWNLLGNDDDDFDWDDDEEHERLIGKMRECTAVLKHVLRHGDLGSFVGQEIEGTR